jgi:bacterioferritin
MLRSGAARLTGGRTTTLEEEGSMATRTGQQPRTTDAKRALLDGLNEDLRGEFQAVIMYRLYASMVQGPWRQELRAFFANEIPEELGHAQILADKIAALGGNPAAEAAPVKVVKDPKEMLQVALGAEEETIERYVRRRDEATAAGEHGLAVNFDDIIADETNHRDELRQILARWP